MELREYGEHFKSMCNISSFRDILVQRGFYMLAGVVSPAQENPRESKTVMKISWPPLDDQVEACQVENTPALPPMLNL